MNNLQRRNFLSGLVNKLRECRNDYVRFFNDTYTGPRCMSFMGSTDIRSDETKIFDSKLKDVRDDINKTIKDLEGIRDVYNTKIVEDLCNNISEDGIIEINGFRYQLVEVTEY